MGGRGSSSKLSNTTGSPSFTPGGSVTVGAFGSNTATFNPSQFQMNQQPPNLAPTAQQAQQANNAAFPDTDNSPFHDLYNGRQYYQQQNLTADQMNAAIQYLRTDGENGGPYSMSQNMNHILVQAALNGTTPQLNANQTYTYRHLMASMHNLGYNVNLTRYDHSELVNRLLGQAGIKNADFTTMSESQLQKALVGTTYGEERFLSTSYNGFKNAPQQTKDTFMNRSVRIEYKAKASTQAMMPGNGPGGAIGEVLLAPSQGRQNMKILGVHFDHGVKVRQKGTSWLSNQSQLVLTVEVD